MILSHMIMIYYGSLTYDWADWEDGCNYSLIRPSFVVTKCLLKFSTAKHFQLYDSPTVLGSFKFR